MGGAFAPERRTYVYRYNTRNPTRSSLLVEHAAESWMMFKGTNTGLALIVTSSETAHLMQLFLQSRRY